MVGSRDMGVQATYERGVQGLKKEKEDLSRTR